MRAPALPSLVKDLVAVVRGKLQELRVIGDSSKQDETDFVLDIGQAQKQSAKTEESVIENALEAEAAIAQAACESLLTYCYKYYYSNSSTITVTITITIPIEDLLPFH